MHDVLVSFFYAPHVFFLSVILIIFSALAAYPIGQIVGAITERRWPRCPFIVIDLAFFGTASLTAYLIYPIYTPASALTILISLILMWSAILGALLGALNRNWSTAKKIAERLIGHVEPTISASVTESQQWQSHSIALPFILSLGLSWYFAQSTTAWAASIFAIAGIVSISTTLFHIPIVKSSIVRISPHHLSPFAIQIIFTTTVATIIPETTTIGTLSALIVMVLMWPMSILPAGLGFVLTIPYLSAWHLAFCTGMVLITLRAMAEFSRISSAASTTLPPWKSLLTAIACALALVQIVWLVFGFGDQLGAGYIAAFLTALGVRFANAMKHAQQSGQSRKDALFLALPLEYLTFILFLVASLSLALASPLPRTLFWIWPLVAALLYYKSSDVRARPLPLNS